jgi:formylglycine-generating enzyme required for sulfatase activity
VTATGTTASTPSFHVEAPGGRAFLEVRRQRSDGVHCAPSWIRLENLPGFDGRAVDPPPRFVVPVPTCEASSADLVEVPAGPVRLADEDGHFHGAFVDAFALDRTEVPTALFSVFTGLERVSGYPAPRAPAEGLIHDALGPRAPAAAIDALTASAFCRFMGKRLPTRDEWRKAARGGELLDGRANPAPERLYPWVGPRDDARVNVLGPDPFPLFAPVDALREGVGPYGHLALVGNQAEWTSTAFHAHDPDGLRVVVGGAWDIEAAIDLHRIDALNGRDPRFFSWAIGVRCAR